MKLHSNFCYTTDQEQIFYATNFPHEEEVETLVVFNYGLVCNNDHWKYQCKYFNERGFKFLIHDYRGHYQSSGRENVNNITFYNIANDLIQILEKIKYKNLYIVGHSMGVNVSLEFVKLYKENNIQKLALMSGTIFPVQNVLMDTHLLAALRPFFKTLMSKYPDFIENFWKYGGWNALTKRIIHSGGFNIKQVDDKFIEIYLNKLGELGPKIFFQLLDQMQEHNALSFVEDIQIPTLVLGGNRDKVIPNFLQRLLAEKIPNSELYLIHEGSHVPQIDFPDLISERLEYFFNH